MPISVTCPHCTATLKAPDDRAGRRAKCTKCGQKLTVPGPSPVNESHGDPFPLPEADAFAFDRDESLPVKDAAPPSRKYREAKVGNPGMKLAVRAVIAGCCVLAVIGGYVLWVRFGPQPEQAKTTPTHADPKHKEVPLKPDQASVVKQGSANLTDTKAAKRGPISSGPTLPPAPTGETLVTKADASIVLPVAVEKIHTLLVGSAGSMGVVIHRSFDGFAGKGAIDTAERFAILSGVPAGKIEIPADGVGPGRIAALAPDGSKLAVEGPPGTLAVWHLDRETDKSPESTFVPFPNAGGKPVPLAACYFLKDEVVAVGPQGQVAVYDAEKKEKVVETGPVSEKPLAEPLTQGKSIAITPDGRTLAFVSGGRIYEVAATSGKVHSSPTALPKGATVHAVTVDPAGARVLVAFTDDTGSRIALYPFGAEKAKVALYFPEALGDPSSAQWLGLDCVLVTGTKEPGFMAFDVEVGKWVAYVKTSKSPGPRIRGTDRAYAFVPAEEGKTKLVGIEWPFDDYFKERDFAVNTKSIAAYVVTADGLKK